MYTRAQAKWSSGTRGRFVRCPNPRGTSGAGSATCNSRGEVPMGETPMGEAAAGCSTAMGSRRQAGTKRLRWKSSSVSLSNKANALFGSDATSTCTAVNVSPPCQGSRMFTPFSR